MKKFVPYLVGGVALVLLLLLALQNPFHRIRKLDERITLRQHDKIPYGTHVAQRLLHATFSNAHMSYDKAAPDYWNDINTDTSNQAVFLISKSFDPETEELKTLEQFVRRGNYVFLITQQLSENAAEYFGLDDAGLFNPGVFEDSLQVTLQTPFKQAQSYMYPGKRFDSYFSSLDTTTARALGNNSKGQPNFVQLQSGSGKIFIHIAPLAFSNYFLLHGNNVHYFQKVMSLIPQGVDKIVWNEYYLAQHTPKEKEPNALRVLWKYQAFRWGLITIVATLLLYVLSTMRRRQQRIPAYTKPANDSLDFVRTIGRLYYERRDHHNLSKKMAAFFLEYVRSRYKIMNQSLDETFVTELHEKSQYNYEELKKMVAFINYINTNNFITEQELANFYQQLHLFYQNTNGTLV